MDRAQLLSGLRTGGPRSASYTNMPLSATPSGAFARQQSDETADMFNALTVQQQALLQLQAQQQMLAFGNPAVQMQMEILRLQVGLHSYVLNR
ncbi:hypothetical protein FRC03_007186 [Tulasnella sp. 419]|nr:hypothetical protein FRC03_007186 [Tulasnella sp. 419]